MNSENDRRFAWQLALLIVFWGAASFTFVVQEFHLPPPPSDLTARISQQRWGQPDPYTFHPWEYNPFNDRETLVEALVIYLGFMYGLFRIINLLRICREDDQESLWNDFWGLCESF